jgi:hypothetical protein
MREHAALENRKAINWAEAVRQAEEEILFVDDEVEAELEVALDAPGAGAGGVSMKRAEPFEYGSAGSASGSVIHTSSSGRNFYNTSSGFSKGDTPSLNSAIARHGQAAVRRAVGNARRGG